MFDNNLIKKKTQSIISLYIIFSLRIFSIFVLLPVLGTYGLNIPGSNKFWSGIVMGCYGVTQVFFQILIGYLSDKIGRKRVIYLGLYFFLLGSFLGSISNNIFFLILARILQGCGAISAPIITLICELTEKKNYMNVMAIFGVCIGFMFILAMVFGPFFSNFFGVKILFFIITILSILCILILFFFVSEKKKKYSKRIFISKKFFQNINFSSILFCIISIFLLHIILVLHFLVFPLRLQNFGFPSNYQWKLYFFSFLPSILVYYIFSSYKNTFKNFKYFLILLICLLFLSELFCFISTKLCFLFILSLPVFFVSFSLLEILLPSLIIKKSSQYDRSFFLSVYSSMQFLGMTFGGLLGGLIFYIFSIQMVFLVNIIIIFLWILYIYIKLHQKDL